MKIEVIASGSKGNSNLLICGKTNVIIDAGISFLTIKRTLEQNQLTPSQINAILITHSHNDHVKGLKTLAEKTGANIYIPEGMYESLKDLVKKEQVRIVPNTFLIDDVVIELIHTSHDAPSSVGYLITYQDKSLVYITDTGYINRKYLKRIKDKEIYVIESNHDEQMLMDGPYPYYLKQRVVGDEGHLSNYTTASYLKELVGEHTKYIVLAHLSEKNNKEELALQEVTNKLEKVQRQNKTILVAKQHESLPLIEV